MDIILFQVTIKSGKIQIHLLQSVHTLRKDVVPSHDHDDRDGGVHQGQGPVLQLTGLDTLAVHVGQLLHLSLHWA